MNEDGTETHIRFTIDQPVHHKKFDYRGVIIDADPVFAGTQQWYDVVARSRPPKDQPWYHVLVDGADHATYVAERHLEPDLTGKPIRHPALADFFVGFENGLYQCRETQH